MTDETNDAWMKQGPRNPWHVLGERLFGCLLLVVLLLLIRLLGTALSMVVVSLPFVLWLLSLLLFARARFWRDPQPLWGRLAVAGPAWDQLALLVLSTILTVALGLSVFVLSFLILAFPFAAGHWF